jgi:hypothetical protein
MVGFLMKVSKPMIAGGSEMKQSLHSHNLVLPIAMVCRDPVQGVDARPAHCRYILFPTTGA